MCRTAISSTSSATNAAPKNNKSSLVWTFGRTWRNHVLYASVYAGILVYCGRAVQSALRAMTNHSSSSSSSSSNVSSLVTTMTSLVASLACHTAIGGLAVLALQAEVSYMWKRRRLPPGDSGLPILGHLPAIMKDSEAFLMKHFERYGPIVTYNLLMQCAVIVTNDEDVRWAMVQERRGKLKALVLPHFLDLLGKDSIMVKSGDVHKRLRKVFEPAFTPTAVRDYAEAIDKETKIQLEKWAESGQFQSPRQWALLAMRIFFICAFGEANQERMEKLAILFEKWNKGFTAPIPFKIPGTLLHEAHGYKDELGKELMQMINEFRQANPPDSHAGQKSVMGRLCYASDEDGNLPSDEVLLDNLRFFMFAGFDTTKASFGAMSHYITSDPRVERLLVEEVQKFPQSDTLDVDQIKNQAPILNAVMAESWRLNAPLAVHAMVATEQLEYKGYIIPKDTFVSVDHHRHAMQNDHLYPNACEFHFERWLPKDHPLYDQNKANTEDIDYNTMSSKFRSFNLGPHMCLGAHFAKLEVRIVLTRLFQKYRLEIANKRLITFPTKQHLNDFKLTKRN